MPTPDPSWRPDAIAAFAQRVEVLDLVRLGISAAILALGLLLFLVAILSVASALRRAG